MFSISDAKSSGTARLSQRCPLPSLMFGGGTATPPYTQPAESAAYAGLFRNIERLPA